MTRRAAYAFFYRNKQFSVMLFLAAVLFLIAVFAPFIAPNDPLTTDFANRLCEHSAQYPLGTDQLGRCLLSRIIFGARSSLLMTFLVVGIVVVIGTSAGILSGYFGGMIDTVIMRVCDMLLAFPGIVFVIALVGVLGPSLLNTVVALTAIGWTKFARVSRSLVMSVKVNDYIAQAKLGGAKQWKIITYYIIPNVLPSLIVIATLDIGNTLLSLAGLSLLGLGSQPPTPEWGFMLSEGKSFMQTAPWLMLYPGLAILITVIIFNLLGDSLRDILDPREEH
ncbi:MAG: nickel transporter permease [Desulfitobacteriaceae bacterium]